MPDRDLIAGIAAATLAAHEDGRPVQACLERCGAMVGISIGSDETGDRTVIADGNLGLCE